MSTVLTGQKTVPSTGRATAAAQSGRRRRLSRKWRRALVAYAFLLLPVGFYAVFMILPCAQTIILSFYNWDGIGTKTGAGLSNFAHVFEDPQLRVAVVHAFELMLYFCVIPIVSALFLTALITGPHRPRWTFTRAVLFLPQVLPAVAVAVIWQWMYGQDGFVNQVLRWVGLGSLAQPWLASFTWAFPAVGLVGSWITLGLCLAFFIAGAQRIPVELYEAIATDGGGRFRQFRWVTLPHLRGEIVIAATVTAISAMSRVRHRIRHDRGRSGRGLDRPRAAHLSARLHVLQRRPGQRPRRRAVPTGARRDLSAPAGRKGAVLTAKIEWLGTRAIMCFALLSIVIPLLVIATTALEPAGSLNTGLSWPAHPHWGNFVSAWSVAGFSTLMRSSAIICVAVVPAGVILATCAGYAFGTIDFPGKRLIFGGLMIGLAVPYEAIVIALYYNLKSVGLTNTYLSVILPLIGAFMPFGAYWMRNHFANTPPGLIEAAQMDGASDFTILTRILLPNSPRCPLDAVGALLHVDLEPVPARAHYDPGSLSRDGAARAGPLRRSVHDQPPAVVGGHTDRDCAGDDRLHDLPTSVHRRSRAWSDQGMKVPTSETGEEDDDGRALKRT